VFPSTCINNFKKRLTFEGIYFDIEGEEEAVSKLELLAEELGAKSIRVSPKEKNYFMFLL